MKIALLTCEQDWQRTLAMRFATRHDLALVVIDPHASTRYRRAAVRRLQPSELVGKSARKLSTIVLDRRDARAYRRYFAVIGCPPFESSTIDVLRPREINSVEVAERLEQLSPDVVVVSGTRIIKQPVLSVTSRFGMINLHTGLSPYYRGGPCTFWCLFNEEPEYAGATVHYISAGIDSGDIILSRRAALVPTDGVASLDSRVIDMGHSMLLEALDLLEQGRAPRVPQWAQGKLYLYRQFTPRARWKVQASLRTGLMQRTLERLAREEPAIRTIDQP